MKIGLAQINPTVGAIKNNAEEIFNVLKDKKGQADLIVFPEMALSGYPAEDLIFRKAFLEKIKKEAEILALKSKDLPSFILGLPLIENDKRYNGAIYSEKGEIKSVVYKYELPNDSVFDEKRVFSSATDINPININGHKVGLMICEDLWHKRVSDELKEKGAEVLIAINASPFEIGKLEKRFQIAKKRTTKVNLPLIYVNMVGGQDELVFDGNSFVMNKNGKVIYKLKSFKEDYAEIDLNQLSDENPLIKIENEPNNQQIYAAMKLGLADYVNKNGVKGVIIGMSGGIDSAFYRKLLLLMP
jgi:predicted amidohydrolase